MNSTVKIIFHALVCAELWLLSADHDAVTLSSSISNAHPNATETETWLVKHSKA